MSWFHILSNSNQANWCHSYVNQAASLTDRCHLWSSSVDTCGRSRYRWEKINPASQERGANEWCSGYFCCDIYQYNYICIPLYQAHGEYQMVCKYLCYLSVENHRPSCSFVIVILVISYCYYLCQRRLFQIMRYCTLGHGRVFICLLFCTVEKYGWSIVKW